MVDTTGRQRPPHPRVLLALLGFLLLVVVVTNAILLHDRRDLADVADLQPVDIGADGWTRSSAGQAVQKARLAARTYFTLDYRTVEDDLDRMRALGTPEFVERYDAGAADLAAMLTEQQRRLSGRLPHDGTATEYVVTNRAIVLVSVDVTIAGPRMREQTSYRARVALDLVDDEWLVSSLEEVD